MVLFSVCTTNRLDVRNKKAVVYFILIGNILRLTSAIVVVFFEGWGFGRVERKSENPKNQ